MLTRRDILSGSSAAVIAGAEPRSAWGRNEADVVIIGAGLAGLYAAHRLEGAGLKAIIVEGELRVGGRLHTLDDLPGKPDAGGIQVGSGYKLFRAIADDLKVALIEGAGGGAGAAGSRSALLRINGMTVTPTEWQSSTANRLPENERSILPQGLGLKYDAGLPRLAASPEWMDADPALDISYRAALVAQGASPEALRLIEANFNGNTLSGMSQLQIMRSAAIFRAGGGPASTIAGGSQRFPEAMARNIKTPIRLGHIVTAITEDADGVAIFTSRGAIHARHAICTIPFAALRQMSLKAPIPPAMAKVIKALPYTRASFAFVSAASPFWREDGLPETLWTDDPLLGRVFVLGDSPPMLKTWTTGTGADLLDRMAPAAAASEIIARLEAARPSAKGKLKVERLFSWQKSPMARGIYHHIGTGQAALLAAAVRAENRRLHFAGEHLAEASSGMEAALESGNRVARMIVARS